MECKHLSTQLKALHPQRYPFADKILCPPLHSPLKDPWTQLTLTCLLHLLGVLAPPWEPPPDSGWENPIFHPDTGFPPAHMPTRTSNSQCGCDEQLSIPDPQKMLHLDTP